MAPITLTEIRKCLTSRVTLAPRAALLRATPVFAFASVAVVASGWLRESGPSGLEATICGWVAAIAVAAFHLLRSASAAPVEETTLGAYRLDEKIGEGGMGVVYKASHALLQRPAAIKLLSRDRAGELDRKRFEREVQLTSQLSHPNTISIYDFGRTPAGTFYYAMEYVDGCDLQTLVDRHGRQDPARVAHLLAQLAGALVEAHSAGLVHRDIKPANVMLCERGGLADVVKVLDFGLTKEVHADDDASEGIVGTPLYFAPETVTAPECVDARSDLYAVGAVGYFLLTGVTPFSGASLLEVCEHHLHTTPVAPSERIGAPIPQELDSLILSCLAKSPADRPQSAAAVQRALLSLAASWTQEHAAGWWAERDTTEAAARPENSIAPLQLFTTQLAAA